MIVTDAHPYNSGDTQLVMTLLGTGRRVEFSGGRCWLVREEDYQAEEMERTQAAERLGSAWEWCAETVAGSAWPAFLKWLTGAPAPGAAA